MGTKIGGQLDDAVPALRSAHHAAQRGQVVLVEVPRGDAVGRDHEVLDELLGAVRLVLPEVGHLAVDHHRPRLDGFQLEGSLVVAQLAQAGGGLVLEADLGVHARHRGERRRHGAGAFEPGGERVVGQLAVVVHPGGIDVRSGEGAVAGHGHLHDDGDAVLAGVERGEAGRELLRQHGEDPGGGVDRGGVDLGVEVDGRAQLHQGVDVGDGDPDADGAIRLGLGDLDLIEVAAVVVVDRRPEELAQVAGGGWRHGGGVEMGRFGLGPREENRAPGRGPAWPGERSLAGCGGGFQSLIASREEDIRRERAEGLASRYRAGCSRGYGDGSTGKGGRLPRSVQRILSPGRVAPPSRPSRPAPTRSKVNAYGATGIPHRASGVGWSAAVGSSETTRMSKAPIRGLLVFLAVLGPAVLCVAAPAAVQNWDRATMTVVRFRGTLRVVKPLKAGDPTVSLIGWDGDGQDVAASIAIESVEPNPQVQPGATLTLGLRSEELQKSFGPGMPVGTTRDLELVARAHDGAFWRFTDLRPRSPEKPERYEGAIGVGMTFRAPVRWDPEQKETVLVEDLHLPNHYGGRHPMAQPGGRPAVGT